MGILRRLFGKSESAERPALAVPKILLAPDATPLEKPPPKQVVPRPAAPTTPTVACPYCGVIIDPPPKRTRKCPECRQRIVRKREWWLDPPQIHYMTEDHAKLFEKREAAEEQRREAARNLDEIGATDSEIARARSQLAKQFGHPAAERDVFWAVANLKATEAMRQQDWHGLQMIYFKQALTLFEEGRAHIHLAQESSKAQIRSYLARPGSPSELEILARCCPVCDKAEGERYKIKDALEKLPIPNANCERWADQSEHGHRWFSGSSLLSMNELADLDPAPGPPPPEYVLRFTRSSSRQYRRMVELA